MSETDKVPEAKHDQRYLESLREFLFAQRASFHETLELARQMEGGLQSRSCPVCSTPVAGVKHDFSERLPPYTVCRKCGLVFMSPVLGECLRDHFLGFDGLEPVMQRYWDLRLAQAARSPSRRSAEEDPHLHEIRRHKGEGQLLDIGCGLGEFLRKAAYFFDAEGIELNPRLRETAGRLGARVVGERLEDLLADANYDVITLHQVLYGLMDPISLMKRASFHLKPGGIIYVNTPNADSLAVKVFGRAHSHFLCTNLNVFNLTSLRRLGEQVGLRVTSWRTEWLDIYPEDIVAHWLFRRRFLHRRNSFMPFYGSVNSAIDRVDRRWISPFLGRRGDYLIAILSAFIEEGKS